MACLREERTYLGFIPTIIVFITFISAIFISMPPERNKSEEINKNISSEALQLSSAVKVDELKDEKILGLWVSYITLDMRATNKSEQAFKEKFDRIVKTAKENKISDLIVQVRSFGDAYYKSSIYPWSHLLSGTQGLEPGYDPLKYMVSSSHENGLKIHAWVNPYRLSLNSNPPNFSDASFYKNWVDNSDSDLVLDYQGNKYLNPYYDEVQAKIIEGVDELVRNYDVDGVQFDDYFYPSEDPSFDAKTYERYFSEHNDGTALSLSDWRKDNINKLVAGVYSKIKSIKSNVVFGISPQVNLQNNEKLSADVIKWCSQDGYVDYICPQVYVNFKHEVLPFDKAANEWKNLVTNPKVKLYFGLAVYKSGSETYDNGTWSESSDILKQEIEYSKSLGINNFLLYDYEHIVAQHAKEELNNALPVL